MIRAVVFDAVGTLIHPCPDFATIYTDVGRRFGSRLDAAAVRSRFRAAFGRQDDVDRSRNWVTSEAREAERWRTIVADVFDDADGEACFAELFAHFARPDAWRVDEHAADVLARFHEAGFVVAMASNFDARLHPIVAGSPALRRIQDVIVSSEVGVRKPGREFFAAIERRLDLSAREIVFVGDDPVNDGEGASAAGMRAIVLGRDVKSLAEVASRVA